MPCMSLMLYISWRNWIFPICGVAISMYTQKWSRSLLLGTGREIAARQSADQTWLHMKCQRVRDKRQSNSNSRVGKVCFILFIRILYRGWLAGWLAGCKTDYWSKCFYIIFASYRYCFCHFQIPTVVSVSKVRKIERFFFEKKCNKRKWLKKSLFSTIRQKSSRFMGGHH